MNDIIKFIKAAQPLATSILEIEQKAEQCNTDNLKEICDLFAEFAEIEKTANTNISEILELLPKIYESLPNILRQKRAEIKAGIEKKIKDKTNITISLDAITGNDPVSATISTTAGKSFAQALGKGTVSKSVEPQVIKSMPEVKPVLQQVLTIEKQERDEDDCYLDVVKIKIPSDALKYPGYLCQLETDTSLFCFCLNGMPLTITYAQFTDKIRKFLVHSDAEFKTVGPCEFRIPPNKHNGSGYDRIAYIPIKALGITNKAFREEYDLPAVNYNDLPREILTGDYNRQSDIMGRLLGGVILPMLTHRLDSKPMCSGYINKLTANITEMIQKRK